MALQTVPTTTAQNTTPTVQPFTAPTAIKANSTTYNPTQATVNQPSDTVQGQMTGLLNQNSDYMKSAKTNALQQMNSRGLLNSSMAVGASQKAAINSALPIANADANTYSQQRISNQNASNAASQYNAGLAAKNESDFAVAQNSAALDANKLNATYKTNLDNTAANNDVKLLTNLRDNQRAVDVAVIGTDEQGGAQLRAAFDSYQKNVANMMVDTNLTDAARQTNLVKLERDYMTQRDTLASVYQLNIGAWGNQFV